MLNYKNQQILHKIFKPSSRLNVFNLSSEALHLFQYLQAVSDATIQQYFTDHKLSPSRDLLKYEMVISRAVLFYLQVT